jgi:hypothetical protein
MLGHYMKEAADMAIKIKSPAKATITHEAKDKGKVIAQEVTEEDVDVPDFTKDVSVDQLPAKGAGLPGLQPHCEVGVEASYTHNLGDFKSARVQVSLRVPCLHPQIDTTYAYAKGWVDDKLNVAIEELMSGS